MIKIKKVISIILLFVALISFTACDKEDVSEKEVIVGGFSMTISVDKTTARVGDTIEVTATLKNISGEDITILLTAWDTYSNAEVEDTLMIAVVPEKLSHSFAIYLMDGPRNEKTIEKDAIIQHKLEVTIEKIENHIAQVAMYVEITNNTDNNGYSFWIYSKQIKISVRR